MNRISSTQVPEEAFQFQFYSSPRPNEYEDTEHYSPFSSKNPEQTEQTRFISITG